MAFNFKFYFFLMSEKFWDISYSFSNTLSDLQTISKAAMLILIAEWGLCKGAHLPKMSGKSCPNKDITKNISSGIKKKVWFIHSELGFLWDVECSFKSLLLFGRNLIPAAIMGHADLEPLVSWQPSTCRATVLLVSCFVGRDNRITHRIYPQGTSQKIHQNVLC